MERNARFAALIYGVVCYALFFATFLYLVAFVGDFVVAEVDRLGQRRRPRPRAPRRHAACSSSSGSSTA